jgi:uncharacterized membrane protein
MKFRLSVLLFVITAFLIAPTSSLACACCAEKGFYSISTEKPEGYTLEVLQDIKFAQDPQLYLDAAGGEDIKGLESLTAAAEDVEYWKFNLTDSFAAKTWKLNFTAYNGKTGTLTLPIPAQMVSFKVDIHDTADSNEPRLYKEWRFKGNVQTGNGIFQAGITKPTTYFLVLQGRGNVCDNAEDFTHWRLEIGGKKADYKFFGKLASGTGSVEN